MHLGWKPVWPFVQVLLIAELALFLARITPFDAPLLPPSQDPLCRLGIAKGDELNAEPPEPELVRMFRREGMLGDQDVFAGFEKFVNQQCGRLEKEQVRIEISHTLHLRRALEHMTRQEGRQ